MSEQEQPVHVDWFQIIAESRGVPDGWRWFKSVVHGDKPNHVFIVTGAAGGKPFKRGTNKGKVKPASRDHATKRDVVITPADLAAAKMQWERDTGKCSACCGAGKTVASAKSDGTKTYRGCNRCRETGRAA